jgi:hypothetical protein
MIAYHCDKEHHGAGLMLASRLLRTGSDYRLANGTRSRTTVPPGPPACGTLEERQDICIVTRPRVHASPGTSLTILVGAPHRRRSGGQVPIICRKRRASIARCREDGAMASKRAGQGCLPTASVAKPSPTPRA